MNYKRNLFFCCLLFSSCYAMDCNYEMEFYKSNIPQEIKDRCMHPLKKFDDCVENNNDPEFFEFILNWCLVTLDKYPQKAWCYCLNNGLWDLVVAKLKGNPKLAYDTAMVAIKNKHNNVESLLYWWDEVQEFENYLIDNELLVNYTRPF